MRKPTIKFADVTREIARINALRDGLERDALQALEASHPALAELLVQTIGDRQRGAHWMCTARRVFGGRTAYELLAEGDVDAVWDEIARVGQVEPLRYPEKLHLAY